MVGEAWMQAWVVAWWVLGYAVARMVAVFDEARAERAVRFFEGLKHTKGQFFGKAFELLPWEREIVRDVFGTVREDGTRQYRYVYIEIPKKNGKSELAAGAALYHLFADGEVNGEVYGCAADRGQASIVYEVAKSMVEQVPALDKRAKVTDSRKRITDRKSGTFYQVLSAEAYTKHGINLSACVFDELHAQPSRDLWDVMTFGAGDARRQPIWWIITTAGDDPDRVSVGWEQHEYAAKIASGDIIDPSWYVRIYGYEGEDIYNPVNWALANPSLGHTFTIESVQEMAERAKQKPADERLFRWLRLNQWITTKLSSWLPLSLFEETAGDWSREDQAGKDVFIGMDLSSTTDLTACALIWPPQGGQLDWRVAWQCWIPEEGMRERIERDHVPYDKWARAGWVSVTGGDVVDYTQVEAAILEWKALYRVVEVASDPAFASMLLQRLSQAELVTVGVPQTYATLTNPMNEVERLLREGKMSHERNAVAGWCFGNTAIAKQGSGLIKYVKESRGKSVVRTKRIDLVAAWVCGMARAMFYKGSVDLSAAILSEDWGL